ncbi:MAG: threonine synthase [Candidatus Lokiarchaeota archaeon]|nr:threonine synthase [Candidatus Lokiarchaeota archaeon]
MENNASYVTNLICTNCGEEFDANEINGLCTSCGKVLYPQYDLEKAKETLSKQKIQNRKVYNIWRLHEIMPVKKNRFRITLGEGWTPIVKLNNFGEKLKLDRIFLKDEGQNPTGTFKSRGLCAAVSKGLELGIKDFVMPSAGNAGAALSAYSAHAGVNAHIYVPKDTPELIQKEIKRMGGELTLVEGLISDAGRVAKEEGLKNNWFSVSTLKEPYRVDGKKTMGLELAEQFDWTLPDIIIYPTGGGTGIVGMWKAFKEMEALGLIGTERPKMVSVQPSGCQPIVRAFKKGDNFATPWENAHSFASGIRVPGAIGDYLILNAIRESKGTAIAVDDSEIKSAMYSFARTEGIMVCPEAAATVAATVKLTEEKFIDSNDSVVLFVTGSGLTTPNDW